MGWSFATVNNKLAEIYFDNQKEETRFLGHCYIDEKDYKTKKEKRWIKYDTDKFQLVYRSNRYRDKLTGKFFDVIPKEKLDQEQEEDFVTFKELRRELIID